MKSGLYNKTGFVSALASGLALLIVACGLTLISAAMLWLAWRLRG